MPETPSPTLHTPPRFQTAQWVIAVILAFIAGMLWSRDSSTVTPTALAQSSTMAGARGVYALAGQLDRETFGLFMLDIEQGTMWCYELDSVDGVRRLRLVAGRSWLYDRYLRDFNCLPPGYREVQDLVSLQRQPRPEAEKDETRTTTEDESPE